MRFLTTLGLLSVLLLSVGCAQLSIWEYARNGNTEGVRKTLDADPGLVNAPHLDAIGTDYDNRWSPLRYAVEAGRYNTAEELLERGADPLQPAHGGFTPYEASKGDSKMERMLREAIEKSGKPLP